mmetsp:Transcript_44045/g.113901  ORF Transcript_44045/g.113901 Transcript_44045/m.113901 type:complete len:285 (+) Transcript_44045:955-1809(+)
MVLGLHARQQPAHDGRDGLYAVPTHAVRAPGEHHTARDAAGPATGGLGHGRHARGHGLHRRAGDLGLLCRGGSACAFIVVAGTACRRRTGALLLRVAPPWHAALAPGGGRCRRRGRRPEAPPVVPRRPLGADDGLSLHRHNHDPHQYLHNGGKPAQHHMVRGPAQPPRPARAPRRRGDQADLGRNEVRHAADGGLLRRIPVHDPRRRCERAYAEVGGFGVCWGAALPRLRADAVRDDDRGPPPRDAAEGQRPAAVGAERDVCGNVRCHRPGGVQPLLGRWRRRL